MMSYDERVVFHSYMESGAERERKTLYELALTDYEAAKGIAIDANDNGGINQAQIRIESCQEKINSPEK